TSFFNTMRSMLRMTSPKLPMSGAAPSRTSWTSSPFGGDLGGMGLRVESQKLDAAVGPQPLCPAVKVQGGSLNGKVDVDRSLRGSALVLNDDIHALAATQFEAAHLGLGQIGKVPRPRVQRKVGDLAPDGDDFGELGAARPQKNARREWLQLD